MTLRAASPQIPALRREPVVVVERSPVRQTLGAGLVGAGAGVAIEYLLDPDRGRTRRARLRDQTVRTVSKLNHGLEVAGRDAGQRGQGVVYGVRYRLRGRTVDDVVLHERVRATLGRYVNHPHAVDVRVQDGVVTLEGDVLADEQERALRAVQKVPGVRHVDGHWRVHEDAAAVPSLQGGQRSREPAPELTQEHWSPAARLLAGTGAVTMWAAARRTRGPVAWTLRTTGVLVGARAAMNLPVKRLVGIGAGRRAVDVQAAISIGAPPERVWEVVSDYASFPRFMTNVREVRHDPDNQISHWVIAGPAGTSIRFDAEETTREEGRILAWKTVAGQRIAHTGAIHLDPEPENRTQVHVHLTYNPVFGAVGHAVAALLGADPRRKLQEDLMRLKSFVETGPAPSDAAWPQQS